MFRFTRLQIHACCVLLACSFLCCSAEEIDWENITLPQVLSFPRVPGFKAACYDVPSYVLNGPERVCLPSIWIAGNEKSGTSALYWYLSKHPYIRSNNKEWCIFDYQDNLIPLWKWLLELPLATTPEEVTMNGCIRNNDKEFQDLLAMMPELKAIWLLRYYPDALWSVYNFWCFPSIEEECPFFGTHTVPEVHIRTPAIFDDIVQGVLDGNDVSHISSPHLVKLIQNPSNWYSERWKNLTKVLSPSRIIVQSTDNLYYKTETTLKQIVKFLDIPDFDWPKWQYHTAINRRQAKGLESESLKDNSFGSGYLRQTEWRLLQIWAHDCMWAVRQFGLDWPCTSHTSYIPPPNTIAVLICVVLTTMTMFVLYKKYYSNTKTKKLVVNKLC